MPGHLSTIAWVLRFLVLPALFALVVLAAIGGYLAYRDFKLESFLAGGALTGGATQQQSASVSMILPPARSIIEVESYAPSHAYPLAAWEIIEDPAGLIEWVSLNDKILPTDDLLSAKPGDVLELGGWAGHRLLGMRFPEVLISLCDIVIAGTTVGLARSDIAESVHPNLLFSGWQTRLYVADFPVCADMTLHAWGRPPIGRTLRPLAGARALDLIDAPLHDAAPVVHMDPLVLPGSVPEAAPRTLTPTQPDVTMHRCAAPECDIVARLPASGLNAVVVEDVDGWVLLQSAHGSGWVDARHVGLVP